ncbi:phage tail protein [Latilactobacillus curvatus]|uniref:Phage tail protein n=1 Tax=Latilactobacillus curvatus TaxID=28038 RepID=A0A385AER3_LATCU|nr:Ig-like domain-containing protein [Latilactobacillus curvatus]AXN36182.1 phage tail protein [Latilactobacillus curvatus]
MIYYIYQNNEKIKEVTDAKTVTITGLAPNTSYTYAVSAWNGIRESAKSNIVTVTTSAIPVTAITLSISQTMEVGNSIKATVTLAPTDATNKAVTYKSSDTTIATVAADGTVKAIKPGTVTITATASSGKAATATIKVYEALVTVTSLATSNVTSSAVTLTWV